MDSQSLRLQSNDCHMDIRFQCHQFYSKFLCLDKWYNQTSCFNKFHKNTHIYLQQARNSQKNQIQDYIFNLICLKICLKYQNKKYISTRYLYMICKYYGIYCNVLNLGFQSIQYYNHNNYFVNLEFCFKICYHNLCI